MLSAWLVSCAACAVAYGYYVPPQVDPWGPSKTPLHHMVDVANEFGLKVLNEHNFFNENNIAFSPYGLAGILVALYEGVDGDSSFQVLESVRFPWNRDIMRVGFRDIHRTLKTYFIPVEGFLTGLALNNENITFKESYTRILDFYGFDFNPKQVTPLTPMPEYDETTPTSPSTTPVTTGPTTSVQTTTSPSTTGSLFTTTPTSLSSTIPTTEFSPTTEDSNVTSTIDITSTSTKATTTTTTTTTTITKTTTTTSVPDIESTTGMTTTTQKNPPSVATTIIITTTETTTPDQLETTEMVTTNVPDSTTGTTALIQSTIVSMDTSAETMENASETQMTSTEPIAPETMADQNTDANMQTEMIVMNSTTPESSTDAMTSNMQIMTNPEVNMTESSTIPVATIETISTNQVTNTEFASAAVTSISETSSPDAFNSTTVQFTEVSTTLDASSTETSTIVENITIDSTDMPSTVTTESQVEIISIPTTPNSGDSTGTNDSTIETLDRKKRSFRGISGIPPIMQEDFVFHYPRAMRLESRTHSFYGETMFLANGLKRVEVSYMTYDAIMEHAYLPYLKASALKLPLDSDKYYLLVILPEYDFPLDALIKRLAHLSNLRDIFSSLRPKYVHACVPSFMIKGHVSLTTDLQRLGIRDVFEPRQNDFIPMTDNKGVYVRNVEQAITVTIRKYSSAEPSERRYVPNQAPVQFGATYPFLFFVMDSTVNVALMAGKMMDPLNSRIL